MYYLFLLGRAITLFLPRSLAYWLAGMLGTLHYCISRPDREAVLYNLSSLVSDKHKRLSSARCVFKNFSYYLVDFFRYQKLDQQFISRYVRISGEEHLKEAFARGLGVIGLSAHIGNYELGATIVSKLGYPISAVALQHKDKRLNDFFDYQRKLTGVKVIPTGIFVKRCSALLGQNEFIALLGDREFGNSGVEMTLCSRRAIVPRGPAFFAFKTNAAIVPVFCIRQNKKFYHLIFEKPILFDASNAASEAEFMGQYLSILEKYIKQYPDQWYLFQRYWLD